MNEPKVLWLIRGLGPGGAERLLVAHAQAATGDFRYEVAYQDPAKNQLVPELEAAGVVVHHIGGGLGWPARLRTLVRDREIDLVHSHSPVMAVGARVALRAIPGGRRPGLLYTEHNRWSAYRGPTRSANAATYLLDHHTFAVSGEARSSVIRPFRERVETVHHGVDGSAVRAAVGDPAQLRSELGISADEILALQVANFRVEKAHEVLVQAASILADDPDNPVRFVMVGQGPLQPDVEALVAAADLGGSVEVLGFRPDVATLLAAADVMVLSSDHEGLPVAIMEALALGVPIVSTAVGGVPEAITDEVEGLLVPPRDPEALAAALNRFAADPALRERLTKAAADRSADFDAANATIKIEAGYDKVWQSRS